MSEIRSTRNARVLEVVALHRARGRREQGRHLVEGPHAVDEALRAGVVDEVFVAEGLRHALEVPEGVRRTEVSDHVLERMADARTPQGVLATARTQARPVQEVAGSGVLVALYEVSDPGNVGTIVRTADAAGASAVAVTRGSADAYSPKAIRAAAGSTYHLPVAVGVEVEDLLAACVAHGQRTVALDASGAGSVFDLEQDPTPRCLLVGNEAHGLPDELLGAVDLVAKVPIHGRAESLNVAAAAAVAIYAAARGVHPSS